MTQYTDEDYVRVAKWLGLDVDDGVKDSIRIELSLAYGRKIYFDGELSKILPGFVKWLLSPEGRCAIEDRLIGMGRWTWCEYDDGTAAMSCIPEYLIAELMGNPAQVKEIGHGPTPASAWLSAAMNASKENPNV